MASLNKVLLIGNVGKDPELKAFQNGDRIANLSLATSEKWKDKASQEKKELTQWHKVVVRNQNIIRTIDMFVKKGTPIVVEGKLTYRKYKSPLDGNEKISTEVIVGPYEGNITLLPGNDTSQSSFSSFAEDTKKDDELDDEIPF
tara:strand:+ start:519 stop:950 length:432 start_codon:yes stop_codon:yes gene_type:complete